MPSSPVHKRTDEIDWNQVEEKWKQIWEQETAYHSDPDRRQKFLVTVAYPYPNSPQHIGHGRTYTLADVHARYKRMRGYNVLFPMGFHYTGTPILAMSRRLISGDTDLYKTFRSVYGVPPEIINTFREPANIARFFHKEIREGMKEMGFSIDWRREFTTIDEAYSKFISWQFNFLRRKGLIIQGSHPVGWCPRDNNPVSQHDTLGDMEPNFIEYILIKFKLDNGYIIPVATLRPETVFGVTNLWINPDVKYVVAQVDGDTNSMWIASFEAIMKLRHQGHNVEIGRHLDGKEIVGEYVSNPITQSRIPIYPASFVDPKDGSGLVMSVPAHAPYDYQALSDFRNTNSSGDISIRDNMVEPIVIIRSEYQEGDDGAIPAQAIIKKLGIKDQHDSALERATTELYSHEFYKGKLNEKTGKYSGMMVSAAKELIRSEILQTGKGETLYEFVKKPVKCRCGEECVVKVLNDQWFLDYSNSQWKDLAHECINRMDILPSEIRPEFNYVVDWLRERACARMSGLGTQLPWDHKWIIESLSDSVIYTAYYIISHYFRHGIGNNISTESLTEDFFDYIFLGKGSPEKVSSKSNIPESVIHKMRDEFTYFYPVDTRHSGRDLVPNHLAFFIFNHVAIFDRTYWPGQIVVNGSVLMDGKKMSKSFGNIIPLRQAIRTHGADAIRIAILSSAELLQDADFSFEALRGIKSRLNEIYDMAKLLSRANIEYDYSLEDVIYLKHHVTELEDRWMLSSLQKRVSDSTALMEVLRVREALHNIIYSMEQDLQWYNKRVKSKGRSGSPVAAILVLFLKTRIRLLAPFAPFLTEEIWSMFDNQSKSKAKLDWPNSREENIDSVAEETESLIKNLIQDVQNILKVTRIKPTHLTIYTSAKWKWKAYNRILDLMFTNRNTRMSDVMRELAGDPEMSKARGDPKLIKKIMEDILSISTEQRSNRRSIKDSNFEPEAIMDAATLISSETSERSIEISVFNEDMQDIKAFDPQSKAKSSRPFKPAIYIT